MFVFSQLAIRKIYQALPEHGMHIKDEAQRLPLKSLSI